MSDLVTDEYRQFLEDLKVRVRATRVRVALSATQELVMLYWSIGRDILAQQERLGWGAGVIARLSSDLRREFPDIKGFSQRNLRYMRDFAGVWPEESIVQQLAAKLPWFHHCLILDRVREPEARAFYIDQATMNGWSRNVLAMQIDRDLFGRQGKAVTNFPRTLPSPESDLAVQTVKDPYVFDFLGLGEAAAEREIEQAMVHHIRDTLLEMGVGFAFVGRQVRLEVGGDEFFLDLLFYHLRLRCYVVVELKAGEFQPEHAGKLNFYLSAVDDLIRDEGHDGPTIGLLLCRAKNRVVAEYALRDVHKPIGVAEIQLTRLLPEGWQQSLPTVETIEAELGDLPPLEPKEE